MNEHYDKKQPLPLYIMVSIPEAKEENIWVEPIVLGVFETKELAREVWKNRPMIKYNVISFDEIIDFSDEIKESIKMWLNI